MRVLPTLLLTALTALALLPAALGSGGSAAARADDDVVEVSIMELTQIEWRPGKRLPKEIKGLDGRKVRIKGFMALDTPEGTSTFRLTYDQCGCSNAKASHFVVVDLGDDTVGYNPDEVGLTGTMAVGEEREDGFVTSLYRLQADSIE